MAALPLAAGGWDDSHRWKLDEKETIRRTFDAAGSAGRKLLVDNIDGLTEPDTLVNVIKPLWDSVDPNKPLSFSSMNGTIDVTLPADLKANVKLRTDHGQIYSDFEVKLGGGAITEKNDTPDGKFKVKMDRTITGTINGGGTEATFKTYNGTIYLRKKK